MQTNKTTYLCFFVVCCMVLIDIYLSTNIALQIVCILLVCVVVGLVGFLAYKLHKGSYTSNEQQSNLQSIISENIALQKELNHYQTKQATAQINSTEVQQLITFNARLTVQNSNLKLHLVQLSEQLQKAKQTPQSTPVVQLPTEQKPNKNRTSKTA